MIKRKVKSIMGEKGWSNKGFTLVEMLVVIAILSSVFLVGLRGFRSGAYDARRISDVTKIQAALELYYNQNRQYPNSLSKITSPLPKDPLFSGSQGTGYYYCVYDSGQSYVVGAKLSAKSSATRDSLHNPGCTPRRDDGNGTLTCSQDTEYCVGPGSSQ